MPPFEKLNARSILEHNISPNDADLAIVPIDGSGIIEPLSEYVLHAYNYSNGDLPDLKLFEEGFCWLCSENRKPILFIVTIDGDDEGHNLQTYLIRSLTAVTNEIRNKKVWVPLMGIREGGLTYHKSFSAIVKATNLFISLSEIDITFLFSLPNNEDGKALFSEVSNSADGRYNEVKRRLLRQKIGFYFGGSPNSNDRWEEESYYREEKYEPRFYERKDDSIIHLKKGDIVILAYFSFDIHNSNTIIKAIGIVKDKVINKSTVLVDWKVKRMNASVEISGYNNLTLSKAEFEDVVSVFSKLDITLFNELFPQEEDTRSYAIANLNSDSDAGLDYLNITHDVAAFARVITARNFEPPLAIALFGKWGSGKSFFMRKLREKIIRLSEGDGAGTYCEGIVHIHFNAWSYLDANLWASIISRIFEGLNDYISENSHSDQARREIEQHLASQLVISKGEVEGLSRKKEEVKKKVDDLNKRKDELNDQLKNDILQLKNNTLFECLQKVDEDFGVRKEILKAASEIPGITAVEIELKEILPEKYWTNPLIAYGEVKSKYTFLKTFFCKKAVWKNIIWLLIILNLIIFVPFILQLTVSWLKGVSFIGFQGVMTSLVIVSAIVKRARGTYNYLQPIVASLWKVKDDYEKKLNEALAKFEQEEKGLRLEIENNKAELLQIDEQIFKEENIIADLKFKMTNALNTEVLYSFINKRSGSDEYKKHLGIISIIRKDLEILSDLFVKHHHDIEKNKDSEQFKSYFSKPLERIILYIDDLDRCPAENVVQVLDAVNLLMAFPLFVVVVGVDPAWIVKSLRHKHGLQFQEAVDNELNGGTTTPLNYLEKIFQIPFHLRNANVPMVKSMVRQLTKNTTLKSIVKSANENDPESIENLLPGEGNNELAVNKPKVITRIKKKNEDIGKEKPEDVILSSEEILLLEAVAVFIGNNPRAIKRYVNLFRIIKAHDDFRLINASSRNDMLAILFLIAIPLGKYSSIAPFVEEYIENVENSENSLINFFLAKSSPFKVKTHYSEIYDHLQDESLVDLANTGMAVFALHYSFIKRFSFR